MNGIPNPNNGLGGAEVLVYLEIPEAVSFQTMCRFGDIVVPNFFWGQPIQAEDLPYYTLGCVAPNVTMAGDVEVSVSFDGHFWASRTQAFTYKRIYSFFKL